MAMLITVESKRRKVMDYRLNDEIQDNYQKINIIFLIVSAITIGAGVCVFIYASPDRELYFWDLLFATIVLIGGCIGMIGALHKYKELPEGEFCCRPGKNSIVSARFSFCVWGIAGLLLYCYYNDEGLSLGQILFFWCISNSAYIIFYDKFSL